jgi:hypothetical protein
LNLERLAIHPRCRLKVGQRIKILAHFPANSIAFYEATPQKYPARSIATPRLVRSVPDCC